MLALDGGGIRGVLTLEVLGRMESMLAEATGRGKDFRLCDFFDYVAGTSTGAIIAAGLALRKSVSELLSFYLESGEAMFKRPPFWKWLTHYYESTPLTNKLKETFGADTSLGSPELCSLLLVVTRNVTTDSPWPISSNPCARYAARDRKDCNLNVPLYKLVRASTAAPVYFSPEVIEWEPGNPKKTFKYEDGGVTPYNNPAFLLYRMATEPAYQLGWPKGERNLLIVSVGTGAAPQLDARTYSKGNFILKNASKVPAALMYGAQVDQDVNCRTAGRCTYGAPIDRELGDLIPRDAEGRPVPLSEDLGRAFLYARYNADLSRTGLDAMGLNDVDPEKVGQLDSVKAIGDLSRVGRKVAEEVKLEHFGPFVESRS